MKTVEIQPSGKDADRALADALQNQMTSTGTLLIDFFSSPGAGKTTLIDQLYDLLPDYSLGVLEADYDSSRAANRLEEKGYDLVRLSSSQSSSLDADMIAQGLEVMDLSKLDMVFLENLGSMARPGSLETGAHGEVLIFSIPEGEDKPLKYPNAFQRADLLVVSKADTIDLFDFNLDRFLSAVRVLNPSLPIIVYSSKTKEGLDEIASWVVRQYRDMKSKGQAQE